VEAERKINFLSFEEKPVEVAMLRINKLFPTIPTGLSPNTALRNIYL
jgi:hypothetical protein